MSVRISGVIVLLVGTNVFAGTFSYECNILPEDAGWDIVQIVCDPDLWVKDGLFIQEVELCPGYPPPGGQEGTYRRSLDEFIGEEAFFIEWRVGTDADQSELPWGGGPTLAAGSQGGVNYVANIARDQVEIWRDNLLPILFINIEPDVPHAYRLELYGDTRYAWYIDGEVVDAGTPEGEYPSFNPSMTWRTKAAFLPNTTQWDYIRYGTIPVDGSGDYDSDGDLDLTDYYFVQECISENGPDLNPGPGCDFADFDADRDTDLRDFATFQTAFTTNQSRR